MTSLLLLLFPRRVRYCGLCWLLLLSCLFARGVCSPETTHSPPIRKFLPLLSKVGCAGSGAVEGCRVSSLRLLQFNVLADGLAGLREDLGMFSRVGREHLCWEYRKHRLLHEIQQYDPDIITLQEVDHYYDFFLPELLKRGYVGYFAPKPTSACLEVSSNGDGCALFVKSKKLRVVSCETKTLALSKAELTDSGELQEDEKSIRAQNQVGLIAVCELVPTAADDDDPCAPYSPHGQQSSSATAAAPPILIGTTHLKSSKTAVGERYRLRAVSQVLTALNTIYSNLALNNRTPAVILCGDFNASPEGKDYDPLTYRAVKAHRLGLRSVYNEDLAFGNVGMSSKELYTTWKARRSGDGSSSSDEVVVKSCIDYIFYKPFLPRTVKDRTKNDQDSSNVVIAFSSEQVAIASLLRFTVYFFGLILPLTSLVATHLTPSEKMFIFIATIVCLWSFEASADGSIFRPQLVADIESIETIRPEALKPVPPLETFFLRSVATISQRLQPLPQYGHPGFEAVAALDIFGGDDLGPGLIPSELYPSDHLSIAADLLLRW